MKKLLSLSIFACFNSIQSTSLITKKELKAEIQRLNTLIRSEQNYSEQLQYQRDCYLEQLSELIEAKKEKG